MKVVVYFTRTHREQERGYPPLSFTYSLERIFQNDSGVTIYDPGTQETGIFYPWHRIHEMRMLND